MVITLNESLMMVDWQMFVCVKWPFQPEGLAVALIKALVFLKIVLIYLVFYITPSIFLSIIFVMGNFKGGGHLVGQGSAL